MPPVDRSECPALELATLADRDGAAKTLLDYPEPWNVDLRNGQTGSILVRAWYDLPDGRRIVSGDYYAGGSTWTSDCFWFAEEHMRRKW